MEIQVSLKEIEKFRLLHPCVANYSDKAIKNYIIAHKKSIR